MKQLVFPSYGDWRIENIEDLREEYMDDNYEEFDRDAFEQWLKLRYDQEKLRFNTLHSR